MCGPRRLVLVAVVTAVVAGIESLLGTSIGIDDAAAVAASSKATARRPAATRENAPCVGPSRITSSQPFDSRNVSIALVNSGRCRGIPPTRIVKVMMRCLDFFLRLDLPGSQLQTLPSVLLRLRAAIAAPCDRFLYRWVNMMRIGAHYKNAFFHGHEDLCRSLNAARRRSGPRSKGA
jgi:hypothetical protein